MDFGGDANIQSIMVICLMIIKGSVETTIGIGRVLMTLLKNH